MKLSIIALMIIGISVAHQLSAQTNIDSSTAKVLSEQENPLPLAIIAAGVEYPRLSLNSSTDVGPGLPFSVTSLDLTMPNDDFKKWLLKGQGVRQKQEHYSLFVPEHHPWVDSLVTAGMPERGNHEAVFNSRDMCWWLVLGCLSDSVLKNVISGPEMHFFPPPVNEFARRDQIPAAREMILEMVNRVRQVRSLSWLTEIRTTDTEYDFGNQRFEWKNRPVGLSLSLNSSFFVTDSSGKGIAVERVSVSEADARKLFVAGGMANLELEVRATVKGIAVFMTAPKLWIEVDQVTLHHRNTGLSVPVRADAFGPDIEFKRRLAPKLIPKANVIAVKRPSLPQTEDRQEAQAPATFTNTLGMQFKAVPGTKVLFCVHETRNADYAAFASSQKSLDGTWAANSGLGKEQYPVAFVSWDDAVAFCKWLSDKEGKSYRLPTDSEWSVAVGLNEEHGNTPAEKHRAIGSVYPWGEYYPPKPGDGNYKVSGVDDGYKELAPVMKYKPNAVGLFDMGGNVWEWCEDWYDSKKSSRVLRGDGFGFDSKAFTLSAYRSSGHPSEERYNSYGFRVVIVPAE